MAKGYAKYIGGGIGWALGGPIGALLGYVLGSMFDGDEAKSLLGESSKTKGRKRKSYEQYRHQTQSGDFATSLLVLSAAVMKADGKIMKSELNYVKAFFTRQFGAKAANRDIKALQELLKKDIPIREVSQQIRYFMEHPMRLQLIHYLFGISKSDGEVHDKEVEIIDRISVYMGISRKDFESIKAMFYKSTKSSYKILEITETASDDDVKKAYRRMAKKYHPDKLRNLGEEHVDAAEEKFVKVQEAYEAIKKKRGIK